MPDKAKAATGEHCAARRQRASRRDHVRLPGQVAERDNNVNHPCFFFFLFNSRAGGADVPAQDPDGAARQDADDAADQRAGRVHQARRERIRRLRHGPQLHHHLRRAGHGRGQGP
jgi:hypothetical protein